GYTPLASIFAESSESLWNAVYSHKERHCGSVTLNGIFTMIAAKIESSVNDQNLERFAAAFVFVDAERTDIGRPIPDNGAVGIPRAQQTARHVIRSEDGDRPFDLSSSRRSDGAQARAS